MVRSPQICVQSSPDGLIARILLGVLTPPILETDVHLSQLPQSLSRWLHRAAAYGIANLPSWLAHIIKKNGNSYFRGGCPESSFCLGYTIVRPRFVDQCH